MIGLGLILGLGAEWMGKSNGISETNERLSGDPFTLTCQLAVSTPDVKSSMGTDPKGMGFWVTLHASVPGGIARSPLSAVLLMRLVNNQAIASAISDLSIEGRTTRGDWVRLVVFSSVGHDLYLVNGGDFKKATRVAPKMLDAMLQGRMMSPHETTEGAVLVAYPWSSPLDVFTGDFRFSVKDSVGIELKQKATGPCVGASINGLAMPVGGTFDISTMPIIYIQDLPGYRTENRK